MKEFAINIWHKVEFDIRYLFSSMQFLIFTLFFMTLGLVIVTIFIPLWTGLGIMYGLCVNIPLLLLLGGSAYQWKRSTLIMNQSLTKLNNISYNLATLIFIIFVGNVLSLFFTLILYVAGEAGIILNGWIASSYVDSLDWRTVSWISIGIITEVNLVLVFAIYFALYRFISNIKNYYIAILVICILYIIFGAALNNYMSGTYYSNATGTLYYFKHKAMMFPEAMFIPSLFFPFYGISQLQTSIIGYPLTGHFALGLDAGFSVPLTDNALPIYFASGEWEYVAIFIQPIAWIVLLFLIGLVSHKIRKAK